MPTGGADVIGPRALNRALLARQLLLERRAMPVEAALEHLVGVQAQAPDAPYVALWSRLARFRTDELATAMLDRRAVRAPLMRATIHLATAADARELRHVVQPVLDRSFAGSPFPRQLDGVDLAELIAAGRALLAEAPRTRVELSRRLSERWPDNDAASLAYAITYRVPLVQIPPRGVWRQGGLATWAAMDDWVPGPPPATSAAEVVLRYLGAFGPATVRDVQTWSGLTRLREVTDGLGDRVRRFRDEAGTELLDLPDAPRPDPDVPAPPRFLPEYDNLLLSHADRTRVNPGAHRIPLPPGNGAALGTVLVDGALRGTWALHESTDAASLTVQRYEPLTPAEAQAVGDEGARLLGFVAPGASTRDVHLALP
jgi:DNA glycosylase AlkZ-like